MCVSEALSLLEDKRLVKVGGVTVGGATVGGATVGVKVQQAEAETDVERSNADAVTCLELKYHANQLLHVLAVETRAVNVIRFDLI
jgi:hypothetical protein